MLNNNPLCIYHGNCVDGFGAAWVIHHAYGLDNGKEVEFHAGVYGAVPPDCKDRIVYIVDFSYPPKVMHEITAVAQSVTWIDHHKSAIEAMGISSVEESENLRHIPCAMNPNRFITAKLHTGFSGALLAWKFFFDGPPPPLIDHISDRDLWRFFLPGTEDINAALFSYPYDFNVWDILMGRSTESLREEGVAITRKHLKDVNELCMVNARMMWIGEHRVPCANMSYIHASDAGYWMLDNNKEAPFAATFFIRADGMYVFSLRGRSTDDFDVSQVAKQFGGGGHKKAAGFTVGASYIHGTVVDIPEGDC